MDLILKVTKVFQLGPIATNKMIIAQIDKRLTNETIRRVEDVTGKLDQCSEVAVCIQEIFYSAGNIQA